MEPPESGDESSGLKVALIHAADHGGGAERSTLSLHKMLLELGHDSHLYVGYKHLDNPNVSEVPRVRVMPGLMRLVYAMERKAGWQHLYAPGFRKLISELDESTDIVHLHSLWGSGNFADLGALPKLARKFPTLMTLRDEWMLSGHCACTHDCERWKTGCGQCPDLSIPPAVSRDGTRFNWRRKRSLLKRCRLHVTTVSNWLRDRVLESPIFAQKSVSVVYNGIDTQVFNTGDREKARRSLGWPGDRFVVLLAGQTVEGIQQGIAQQAVEALNLLDDSRLFPVVVGHSAEKVSANLRQPGLTLPFQNKPEDIAQCYRASDVTLVSSEVETFGRIAAESQACGTPVVTFATGGLPEVVKDGVGGRVIERFDVPAFAKAIIDLKDNREVHRRMSDDAAAWASRNFSNEVIAANYLEEYRKSVNSRRSAV